MGAPTPLIDGLGASVFTAERHQNVATAEGRGSLSRKTKPRQGRKTIALEKSFAPAGAWFCANGNHGLRPWLCSDAAPRLLLSHPDFTRHHEFWIWTRVGL